MKAVSVILALVIAGAIEFFIAWLLATVSGWFGDPVSTWEMFKDICVAYLVIETLERAITFANEVDKG